MRIGSWIIGKPFEGCKNFSLYKGTAYRTWMYDDNILTNKYIYSKPYKLWHKVLKDSIECNFKQFVCLYYKLYKNKIYGWYLRKTNKTQKHALAFLERVSGPSTIYKCPECYKIITGDYEFENHITNVHGYPRDMDIIRFHYTFDTVQENKTGVKKANSEYLKYL